MNYLSIPAFTLKFLFLSLCAMSAIAADIKVEKSGRHVSHLSIVGEITSGDTEKMLLALQKHPSSLTQVMLDSRGGSVLEAIRLSDVIREAALMTVVRPRGICASACFFLYAAGAGRISRSAELMDDDGRRYLKRMESKSGVKLTEWGFVGIHRPYVNVSSATDPNQANAMRWVASYMEKELFPRKFIDLMMSRPSNDIYWLTSDDLTELGDYSPTLEEHLIKQCGYVKNAMERALKLAEKGQGKKGGELLAQEEKAQPCVSDEIDKMNEAGMRRIKAGWKPPMPSLSY